MRRGDFFLLVAAVCGLVTFPGQASYRYGLSIDGIHYDGILDMQQTADVALPGAGRVVWVISQSMSATVSLAEWFERFRNTPSLRSKAELFLDGTRLEETSHVINLDASWPVSFEVMADQTANQWIRKVRIYSEQALGRSREQLSPGFSSSLVAGVDIKPLPAATETVASAATSGDTNPMQLDPESEVDQDFSQKTGLGCHQMIEGREHQSSGGFWLVFLSTGFLILTRLLVKTRRCKEALC